MSVVAKSRSSKSKRPSISSVHLVSLRKAVNFSVSKPPRDPAGCCEDIYKMRICETKFEICQDQRLKNEDMPTRDFPSIPFKTVTIPKLTPGNLKWHIPPLTIGIYTVLHIVGWIQKYIKTRNWSNWNKSLQIVSKAASEELCK